MLGLHCVNKEWRIIYTAETIDRHLIRQIIWAEISRTFGKLFLYMNQGRLHRKAVMKRGQSFGFHTASWTGVSAEWCQAPLWAVPSPGRWCRGKSATYWVIGHASMSVPAHLSLPDRIWSSSSCGVFQIAPRNQVCHQQSFLLCCNYWRQRGDIQSGKLKENGIPFSLTLVYS